MTNVVQLKNSRAGYKSHLTRADARTFQAFEEYNALASDKRTAWMLSNLMSSLAALDSSLQKYTDAHFLVIQQEPVTSALDADEIFIGLMEDKSFSFHATYNRVSAEYAAVLSHPAELKDVTPTSQNNARPIIKSPPMIEADIDLKHFNDWLELFDNYAAITGLQKQSRETQLASFWSFCSSGFLNTIRRILQISQHTADSLPTVRNKIQEHLRSKRNQNLDWQHLLAYRQQQGQTVDNYYAGLIEQVDYVGTIEKTSLLTAILVLGCRDEDIKRKILAHTPPYTLNETFHFMQTQETAKLNVETLSETTQRSSLTAAGVSTPPNKPWPLNKKQLTVTPLAKKPSNPTDHFPASDSKRKLCYRCGHDLHDDLQKCPALGKTCQRCGRLNHFTQVCMQSKPLIPSSSPTKSTNSINIAFTCAGNGTPPTIAVDVRDPKDNCLLGTVKVVPDTGSDGNVVGIDFLEAIHKAHHSLDPQVTEEYISVDGHVLDQAGTLPLRLCLQGRSVDTRVLVCFGVQGAFLSLKTCKALNLIHSSFPQPLPSAPQVVAPVTPVVSPTAFPPSNIDHPPPVYDCVSRAEWIASLPDNPTDSERQHIVSHLKGVYAKAFYTESTGLQTMIGPTIGDPMKIELCPDAVPHSLRSARSIPFAQRDKVKCELDGMISAGIIELLGDRPTDWCHPMVVVPKPNGGIRICVDLTKLNKQVKRTVHPVPTPAHAVGNISHDSKFFTTLDAKSGYWQMALHPDSQDYTCFITPWGRYRFLRSPMGFISTGDSYSLRGDLALSGIPHVQKIIDDILIDDSSFRGNMDTLCDVLERCVQYQITLNGDKCKFGCSEVKFVGYNISHHGIAADPSKLSAISQFPEPSNRTQLRSFLGLVNQLGAFSPEISAMAGPLRDNLRTSHVFCWNADHTAAFNAVKQALVLPPVLAQFDPSADTVLQTDASKLNGLGYVLLQKQHDQWRLIQCGSRFLQPAETRYAMVELEALAIVWAVKKCHIYLAGLPTFTILTDHRPLIPILNSYTLDMIDNPKLQSYIEKLSAYQFQALWRKGQEHRIPDALSRAPVDDPCIDDDTLSLATPCLVAAAHLSSDTLPTADTSFSAQPLIDPILEELKTIAATDTDYQSLIKNIETDFCTSDANLPYTKLFKKIWNELSVDDGLILFNARLVIPHKAQKSIIARLHEAHQGIEKTKRRARQTVYWPGINHELQETVEKCQPCQVRLPSQSKEPMCSDPLPTRVFESVSTDLFSHAGHTYMIYTDRLSGFPFVAHWQKDPTSTQIIAVLRELFTITGVPTQLRSDGGPQYKSETFTSFLRQCGITWTPSSPYFPQSNGHAESSVKSMKSLITKCPSNDIHSDSFLSALLELRNSPRSDGRSPAQHVYGHPLRSRVPAHYRSFAPDWQKSASQSDHRRARELMNTKRYYNRGAHPLPALAIGQLVLIQHPNTLRWDQSGTIVEANGRNYHIRMPSGKIIWRNRHFLRRLSDDPSIVSDHSPMTVDHAPSSGVATTDERPQRSKQARQKPSRYGQS